jgi:phosphoserine phosphatase
VQTVQAAGLKTVLVSGGFTFFSDRLRARLKLDFARANVLQINNNQLTGQLLPQPWGDIVDGPAKRHLLLELCDLMGISPQQAMAVGDGANDLPMMQAAGLSVAYHAKPVVQARAQVSITQGGLDRALEVFAAPC